MFSISTKFMQALEVTLSLSNGYANFPWYIAPVPLLMPSHLSCNWDEKYQFLLMKGKTWQYMYGSMCVCSLKTLLIILFEIERNVNTNT